MTLAHDRSGEVGRPSVLLLHAGVADRRMWDPQWDALSRRFDVVRPDLCGFGESPLPVGPYRTTDEVIALLDHLEIAQAALVGASYGGRIALGIAGTHPGRVQRLVLVCPSVPGMRRTAALEQFGESEDHLIEAGDIEGAVALNVRTWLGPEASAAVRTQLARMQRRAFELQVNAEDHELDGPEIELAAIAMPTLVVSGAHDLDAFRFAAADLVATLPKAQHLHLDWAGHLPSLERPREITDVLIEALSAP